MCHICNQEETYPNDWYAQLCQEHRSEYLKKRRDERLERKKNERYKHGTRNPVCAEIGHSYISIDIEREQCKRCGLIICDRTLLKEFLRNHHATQISNSLNAERYFLILKHHVNDAPVVFHPIGTHAKVANILYYMRYTLGHDAGTICRMARMPESTLNAYIMHFTAYERNGKVAACID